MLCWGWWFPNDQPGVGYFEYLQVPIKVVMLNNHSLGMVRQWQESFYEGRTSESVFDTLPDFQLMAQAYGIKNYKFDNPETLAQDLKSSLSMFQC